MDEESIEAEKQTEREREGEREGEREHIPNETGRFVVKRQELEGIIHRCNRL